MKALDRRISDGLTGHSNHFDAVRFVAACTVLFSHSFTLSTGRPGDEPFVREIGLTLGTMAVDVFFITSGFLVTGSIVARQKVFEFFVARALRIYPGLWVSQILTVACIGFWFTSLTPAQFFTEWQTWHYLLKNCLVVRYMEYSLPGAFELAPYRGAVNSSLWSLPIELRMYFYLALCWVVVGIVWKARVRWFGCGCAAIALACIGIDFVNRLQPGSVAIPDLTFWTMIGKFFAGATLRLFADRVPSGRWPVAIAMAFLALALLAGGPKLFGLLYCLLLPYIVVCVGAAPAAVTPGGAHKGDYSYGLYVYAYPVQQAIATVCPGITPAGLFALAYPCTLLMAAVSWHAVERHALRLKSRWRLGEIRPRRSPAAAKT